MKNLYCSISCFLEYNITPVKGSSSQNPSIISKQKRTYQQNSLNSATSNIYDNNFLIKNEIEINSNNSQESLNNLASNDSQQILTDSATITPHTNFQQYRQTINKSDYKTLKLPTLNESALYKIKTVNIFKNFKFLLNFVEKHFI